MLISSDAPQIEDLAALKQTLREFARERDWEKFHSPKNLAMALSGECGELIALFQWVTEAQSRDLDATTKSAVQAELADVLIYLVRISDELGIDLIAAAREKVADNARRYPVGLVAGSAEKRGK